MVIKTNNGYYGDLLSGSVNRTELMQNLRTEALKYFLWVIDLPEGTQPTDAEMKLFEICLPYINVVFDEFGDRDKSVMAEKFRELVLDKARDQIDYFKQDHHEYRAIFRVADIDSDAVIRLTPENELLTVSREEARNNLLVDNPEHYTFISDFMTRLRTPEGRAIAESIFDTQIAKRNVNNSTPLDEYKNQLIDKLLFQTEIYLIENGLYLIPGLPNIYAHTSRNVTQHIIHEERALYALWFGELFLRRIYDDYGFETVLRLMLEGDIEFDKSDMKVLQMGRDEQFWVEMTKIANALELMNPRKPPNDEYFRIERVYRKALQLRVDDNSRRGMQPLYFHFLHQSYDDLDALFRQYPDADDDEMVRRSWPIIIKHAEELIQIGAFNKGGIKDIFRDYDIYCEKVIRNTPDGRILVPQHGKPSRLPTPQEAREEKPILDITMKARDPALLRKLFNVYLSWRHERMGVPKADIDAFREKLIGYIINNMHIDVVRDKNSLIPFTTTHAHARSGYTRRFDYDGKLYGVWIGELRIRTLTLADKGPEILAWILFEEAQHFSPDGQIFKPHPENSEHIYTKMNDYLEMTEHGTIFESMMSFFHSSLDQGLQNYSNFSAMLRDYTLSKSNNPVMNLLDDSVRYFLDTNLRDYLEKLSIPLQDKIQKVKQDIVTFIIRYGSLQDEKMVGFAVSARGTTPLK